MSEFFWDTETRGRLKLGKHGGVGSARYLRDPHTQILLIIWTLGDAPVQVWRWGDPIEPLLTDFKQADRFIAHNIPFDRCAWNLHMLPLGLPPIPLERCIDTATQCRAIAVPAGLEGVAKVLLPPEFHKANKSAVLRMSRPRARWPNEDRDTLHWDDAPESWAELIRYAIQDVEVLRALHRVLPPLPPFEQEVLLHDQILNERGLYLDGIGIAKACDLIKDAKPAANARLAEITGGAIKSTDRHKAIREWVNKRGCTLADMKKASLQKELARADLPAAAREVLELRLSMAQAAAAKPIRMRAWRCEDGRAYQTLIYHQAATGRWAGTGVQFQNVKKEGDEIADDFAALLDIDQEQEDAA
jgi:DNA polymerase